MKPGLFVGNALEELTPLLQGGCFWPAPVRIRSRLDRKRIVHKLRILIEATALYNP